MLITVDRTSVAAGDDALPHVRSVDVSPETPLAEVVAGLLADHFLATVAGGRATWIVTAGEEWLGVVAQQWDRPRYLVDATRPVSSFASLGSGATLLFRYRKQHDPEEVLAELAAGRHPRR